MAPNGFAHYGKEKERPREKRSNLLAYGIASLLIGFGSSPVFGYLVARTDDSARQGLYLVLGDVIGIAGLVCGFSLLIIGFLRKIQNSK